MKISIEDYSVKKWLGIGIVIGLVIVMIFIILDSGENFKLEGKDIGKCLNDFCISRGYDSVYSFDWIAGEYLKLTCKGISDFKFKMEDFDFYDYDLKGICIQYEN